MRRTIEKVASAVISLLSSDLKVSMERRMFVQVQSPVDSQLPDRVALVSTVQTRVK